MVKVHLTPILPQASYCPLRSDSTPKHAHCTQLELTRVMVPLVITRVFTSHCNGVCKFVRKWHVSICLPPPRARPGSDRARRHFAPPAASGFHVPSHSHPFIYTTHWMRTLWKLLVTVPGKTLSRKVTINDHKGVGTKCPKGVERHGAHIFFATRRRILSVVGLGLPRRRLGPPVVGLGLRCCRCHVKSSPLLSGNVRHTPSPPEHCEDWKFIQFYASIMLLFFPRRPKIN